MSEIIRAFRIKVPEEISNNPLVESHWGKDLPGARLEYVGSLRVVRIPLYTNIDVAPIPLYTYEREETGDGSSTILTPMGDN